VKKIRILEYGGQIFAAGIRAMLESTERFQVDAQTKVATVLSMADNYNLLVIDLTDPLEDIPAAIIFQLTRAGKRRVIFSIYRKSPEMEWLVIGLGARGILLGSCSESDVIGCIDEVVAGRFWPSADLFETVNRRFRSASLNGSTNGSTD
jgi:DNA-binding NarL/FixJ family response regulator